MDYSVCIEMLLCNSNIQSLVPSSKDLKNTLEVENISNTYLLYLSTNELEAIQVLNNSSHVFFFLYSNALLCFFRKFLLSLKTQFKCYFFFLTFFILLFSLT